MNFSFFTVFLKNRNISSKIKRSKVTDYAALNELNTSKVGTKWYVLNQNLKNMSQYLRDGESARYYEEILANIDNRKGNFVMSANNTRD